MASSNPLIGQISRGLQWAGSRSELPNRTVLCPHIRWIWLWMWTALVECASLPWPDLILGWRLCWKKTSTYQHPWSFGVQWTFKNMCSDAAGVWRHVVAAAHCCCLCLHIDGSPMSKPPLKQRLPKLQELWGRGVIAHTSKSLCTPVILSILVAIWVLVFSMMWSQLQLSLQKRFLSANELFMSTVPSPSCSSRLLHSGEEIIPGTSDWTPNLT